MSVSAKCDFCHRKFQKKARANASPFCSVSCRDKDRYRNSNRTIYERLCRGCGAAFVTRNGKKILCRPSCRRKPEPIPKRCLGCDQTFEGKGRSLYCSKKCQYLGAWTKRKKDHRCQWCEKLFAPKAKDRIKYCSQRCAHAAQSTMRIYPRRPRSLHLKILHECRCCGCWFLPKFNRVFCKPECSRTFQQIQCRLGYRLKHWGSATRRAICPRCGVEFELSHGLRRFCSKRCLRATRKKVKRKRLIKYLRARDGDRCQLCRGKIKFALRYPHPRAVTIDHIVAASAGGSSDSANLQLAHWSCNVAKSNRPGGQLILYK